MNSFFSVAVFVLLLILITDLAVAKRKPKKPNRPLKITLTSGVTDWRQELITLLNQEAASISSPPRQHKIKPRPPTPPYSGQLIRLRNKHLVEVYRTGKWGLVCDDNWDEKDANVACRQLGFSRGASSWHNNENMITTDMRLRSSILMDDVACTGQEHRLHDCMYDSVHDCTVDEAASVICFENKGCPQGWKSGHGKCYRLGQARSAHVASKFCSKYGASLAQVESKEESDFISNFLMASAQTRDQLFYTSGARSKTGKWEWVSRSVVTIQSKRSRRKGRRRGFKGTRRFVTKRQSIQYTNWFPGWSSHNNSNAEPTSSRRNQHNCLALTARNKDPNGGLTQADYFYWVAVQCHSKSYRFICESKAKKQKKVQECYTGNGSSYKGKAYISEKGSICQNWSQSSRINDRTHKGKGLGNHNYCRNPDNDRRPWCWVDHHTFLFGYCKLSPCSSSTNSTTPSPPATDNPDWNCPRTHFYCSGQQRCISSNDRCDNKRDCLNGEDENNCEYTLANFIRRPFLQPASTPWREAYLGVTNEKCAKACVASSSFRCQSFDFNPKDSTCHLYSHDVSTMKLYNSTMFDFYELKGNCVDMFTCSNGVCINQSLLCDGSFDCQDFTDEMNCSVTEEVVREDVSVHLVGGEEHSGTVEITYKGVTGVICDDRWDAKDAAVICRMLGYGSGSKSTILNFFNYPLSKVEFLLDDVQCVGNETSVSDCPHSVWKKHDCAVFEVAGVRCQVAKVCRDDEFHCSDHLCVEAEKVCDQSKDCPDGSDETNCTVAEVRLVNGASPWEGRVEIDRNGLVGTVCDDQWDDKDATVVCGMLGYRDGGVAIKGGEFGKGSGPIWMDNVDCLGNETALDFCNNYRWAYHDCSHSEDAGVRCHRQPTTTTTTTTTATTTPTTTTTQMRCTKSQFQCVSGQCIAATDLCDMTKDCNDGSDEADCKELQVRLVNGSVPWEGRVELVRNGVAGSVCDDQWDELDASVVCRMLGYRPSGLAERGNTFGMGSGLIWLDQVECTGNEKSLEYCQHNGWAHHDCGHFEDAGVRCIPISATTTPNTTPTTISTTIATTTTTTASATNGLSVFLVGGKRKNEGNVALLFMGREYRVCDDTWDELDATVVCRMLGYRAGGLAVGKSYFGEDESSIFLDNVLCNGNETSLVECRALVGVNAHDCGTNEFAGVICILSEDDTTSTPITNERNNQTNSVCGLRPFDSKDLFNHSGRRRRRSPIVSRGHVMPNRHVLGQSSTDKILGGSFADHGANPWQVRVIKTYNIGPNGRHRTTHSCGAVIISEYWILSAAHCFWRKRKSQFRLVVGDHHKKFKDRGEQTFKIEDIFVHPNYRSFKKDNDISLIKVQPVMGRGIQFNDYVQPACLPNAQTPYVDGTKCLISGWGSTRRGYPNTLKAAEVPLISWATCRYLYDSGATSFFTPRMFCAGHIRGGSDTCDGDSGGPLVCNIDGVYTLFGITSFGWGCGKPNAPGVYTRVSEFNWWINRVTYENGKGKAQKTLPKKP